MLSREYRLTEKSDFDRVKEKGRVVQSNSFALAVFDRKDGKPSRFGFIVSTKISKASTLRNRAKRALREGARHALTYVEKGFDCVFLAKPIIVKKYTDELMREVGETLKKAEVAK